MVQRGLSVHELSGRKASPACVLLTGAETISKTRPVVWRRPGGRGLRAASTETCIRHSQHQADTHLRP